MIDKTVKLLMLAENFERFPQIGNKDILATDEHRFTQMK